MAGLDANDLRLRIQSSFSVSELRRLLLGWGAMPEEIEGDPSSLAQRAVRLGDQRFGAAEMLRKLRAEKPLTEWPDPTSEPDERWAPAPAPTQIEPVSEALPEVSPPSVAPSSVVPSSVVPPSVAPSSVAPSSVVPSSVVPSSVAPSSVGPPSTTAPPRPNALVFLEPEALRRRPTSGPVRWAYIAIGASILIALVGAIALAISFRGASPSSTSASSPVTPPRSDGPAGKAANVFDGGMLRVADFCGIDVRGEPTIEVFALVQVACGRDEVQRQARAIQKEQERLLRGDSADDPFATPPPARPQDRLPFRYSTPPPRPPEPTPAPAPKTKPAPTNPAAKTPRVMPGSRGCMGRCQRTRDECARSCGPEPSDASQYGGYQACTGRCVAAESKCRSACM